MELDLQLSSKGKTTRQKTKQVLGRKKLQSLVKQFQGGEYLVSTMPAIEKDVA